MKRLRNESGVSIALSFVRFSDRFDCASVFLLDRNSVQGKASSVISMKIKAI